MEEKYLPIGTVVILKKANKKVMITGFCVIDEDNPEKIWDYSACIYPEGLLSSEQTHLFDHNQIEKIYHMGFVDEEEKEFKIKLNKYMESRNSNK